MSTNVPVFGLDLCSPSARIAVAQQKRSTVRVTTLLDIPLEQSGIETGSLTSEQLGNSLRTALTKHAHHLPHAAIVAIPDTQTFIFTIAIRRENATDLAEAIRWEASQHLPYDLEELSLDWQILTTTDEHTVIQIAATTKTTATTYDEALHYAGIQAVGIVPASLAAINILSVPDDTQSAIIVLLERSLTTVIAVAQQEVLATLTTEYATEARMHGLVKQSLSLDDTEAQKTLRLCIADPTMSREVIDRALRPELQSLASVIQRTKEYAEQSHGQPCSTLIPIGEASLLQTLSQTLQTMTGLQSNEHALVIPPVLHGKHDHNLSPLASLVAIGAAVYPQS